MIFDKNFSLKRWIYIYNFLSKLVNICIFLFVNLLIVLCLLLPASNSFTLLLIRLLSVTTMINQCLFNLVPKYDV